MTYTTYVVLHDDADAIEVLRWINAELLGAPDAVVTRDGLRNIPNQGFDAWVQIEPKAGPDEDWPNRPAGSVTISIDTAYGYGDIGPLHARYITALAARYGPLSWRLEHDGTWHPLDDLPMLIGATDQAQAWFADVAAPLIHKLGGRP